MVSRTTPFADLPELLTPTETAAWVGCAKGTIYAAIQTGKLPVARIGRLVRVPRSALAALVALPATPSGLMAVNRRA